LGRNFFEVHHIVGHRLQIIENYENESDDYVKDDEDDDHKDNEDADDGDNDDDEDNDDNYNDIDNDEDYTNNDDDDDDEDIHISKSLWWLPMKNPKVCVKVRKAEIHWAAMVVVVVIINIHNNQFNYHYQ